MTHHKMVASEGEHYIRITLPSDYCDGQYYRLGRKQKVSAPHYVVLLTEREYEHIMTNGECNWLWPLEIRLLQMAGIETPARLTVKKANKQNK